MSGTLTVRGTDMFVGETRQQGIIVTNNGAAVTPANATYQRFHGSTVVDVSPVAATINGNEVYADISAGATAGSFFVIFYFTVDTQTVKAKVNYNVLAVA